MANFDEAAALACDPFDGDFSGPNDRTLRDRIVTARKGGKCHDCAGNIMPGERVRSRTDIMDGEIMRFRWCQACCEAMAKTCIDDEPYIQRINLGHQRRAESGEP